MTEITNDRERFADDAFSLALFCAPIATVILALPFEGLNAFMIAALLFGALPYLLFGGPAFLRLASRGVRNPLLFGLAGVLANLATPLFAAPVVWMLGGPVLRWMQVFVVAGSAMAFLWGLAVGCLYAAFSRWRS